MIADAVDDLFAAIGISYNTSERFPDFRKPELVRLGQSSFTSSTGTAWLNSPVASTTFGWASIASPAG
jgi:hypothetical protein